MVCFCFAVCCFFVCFVFNVFGAFSCPSCQEAQVSYFFVLFCFCWSGRSLWVKFYQTCREINSIFFVILQTMEKFRLSWYLIHKFPRFTPPSMQTLTPFRVWRQCTLRLFPVASSYDNVPMVGYCSFYGRKGSWISRTLDMDWPGLCLFNCCQPSCVVCQLGWFWAFFCFKIFPILPPPPPQLEENVRNFCKRMRVAARVEGGGGGNWLFFF